jgi:hypothetical protein
MRIHRRKFLGGLGGAMVALPFLESVVFTGSRARATTTNPVVSLFFKTNCGVAQRSGSEPERFWPSELGTLTPDILGTRDADRALSELAPYADHLLVVRGVDLPFSPERCGHAGNTVQTLTAARIVIPDGEGGSKSIADGESIDWRIGRECNPAGVEALNLLVGRQDDYFRGPSYSAPQTPRAAQNNPLAVYTDLMGLSGVETDLAMRIAQRRSSVNDLVRDEMRELLGSAALGSADRARLETHFEVIRDTELTMACELGGADVTEMSEISDAITDNGNRVAVAKIMMNLAALQFSCDMNRSVLVQMAGKSSDDTRYTVDGALQNTFHRISHRIDGDGDEGDPIPNADYLHHMIDRIMADIFRHLLDRLSMYEGPSGGPLLDDCLVGWTNECSNGPPHGRTNMPWVLAGRAGGFIRTGQYIDAGGIPNNKLLNTILSAHGLRNEDGGYFDSFGDPSLERGVIEQMIA